MDNKYVFAVVGGVFIFLWYFVGRMEYFGTEEISHTYMGLGLFVLILGGGAGGGSDVVSASTSSFTDFIGNYIGLVIAFAVSTVAYDFIAEGGFDLDGLVSTIANLLASGILLSAARANLSKVA